MLRGPGAGSGESCAPWTGPGSTTGVQWSPGRSRGQPRFRLCQKSSNPDVALDARRQCYTSHPLEIEGRNTVNEYMVWLKDGRTVIVRANTVVVRSTQVLFMDATRDIIASFSDHAGWAKRDNVSESADAGEGDDST